jgi:outer membrane receptor protein involved in Fe transport
VSVLHSGFNTVTRDGIKVMPDQATEFQVELTPTGTELPEFVVIEPYIAGSLASVLAERQEADTISDILSAEQISRGGDSDAAGALKRVAGLTLVGDGFVYVRGMGERYSSTTLNGMTIPSPDPTRRVVPLDLFPADILDSVLVQKTFSAWVPGEFGGGTIELRTVGIPETSFFSASAGLEYLSGTTFDDGLTYDGGGRDWTGYDDGARAFPDSMCEALCDGTELILASRFRPGGFTHEEIEQFGEDLSGVWDIDREKLGPNGGASVSLGAVRDWNSVSAGFTASLLWDHAWENREEIRRSFAASNTGLAPVADLTRYVTYRDVAFSGFFSGGLSWLDRHDIRFTNMLLRKSRDRTQVETGIADSPDQEILRRRLQWVENQLRVSQLEGNHVFPGLDDFQVNWQLATAQASREEPNSRRYFYESDNTGQLALSSRAESNSVSFASLEDESDSWNLEASHVFDLSGRQTLRLRAGGGATARDRDSSLRRFSFQDVGPLSRDPELRRNLSLEEILTDETIGRQGFQLRETTAGTDNYVATQDLQWLYANLDYEVGADWTLSLGYRQEDMFQRVETFELFSVDPVPVVGELESKDALPAAAVTWQFRPDMQLRLAWSETVNRPDFREMAAAPYEDPLLDEIIFGNPELEQALIENYDLRWEWYPTSSESISVAAFYKQFSDPIEKIIQPGTVNLSTLKNALGAENSGVELDFRVELGRWHEAARDWFALRHIPFDRLYLAGNLTWIDSEIELDPDDVVSNTNAVRPLEGQSPYVVNFQLGYDHPDSGLRATMLYNVFGERIVRVGQLGAPDIYEQPAHVLDFTLSLALADHWRLGFKAKNLLDTTFEYTQGPEVTRQYQKGRSFSVSLSYRR